LEGDDDQLGAVAGPQPGHHAVVHVSVRRHVVGFDGEYPQFLLPGTLVMTVLLSGYAGLALITDLTKGRLDRFKSMPIGASKEARHDPDDLRRAPARRPHAVRPPPSPAGSSQSHRAGCGLLGGFVPELSIQGYDVTGIDPEAPEGPAYRTIEFEAYDVRKPVDAIVACVSLHHVRDLERVLDKVADCLVPGAVTVVAEWAYERFDEPTALWCFDRLGPPEETGWLHRHRDSWQASGLSWESNLEDWADAEGLHGGDTIIQALRARFETRVLTLRLTSSPTCTRPPGPTSRPPSKPVSSDRPASATSGGAREPPTPTFVLEEARHPVSIRVVARNILVPVLQNDRTAFAYRDAAAMIVSCTFVAPRRPRRTSPRRRPIVSA
jgi:SAM-dependent methyltransferase